MPATKHRARYVLKYRVTALADAEGLRKWWADQHTQDEALVVHGTSYEDAWYTVFLMHDQWERASPQIERLSAARRKRSRVRQLR